MTDFQYQHACLHWSPPAFDWCPCKQVRQVLCLQVAVEQASPGGGADCAWVLPPAASGWCKSVAWRSQRSQLQELSRISGGPARWGHYHQAEVGVGFWPHGVGCSRRLASSSRPRPSVWCVACRAMRAAGFSRGCLPVTGDVRGHDRLFPHTGSARLLADWLFVCFCWQERTPWKQLRFDRNSLQNKQQAKVLSRPDARMAYSR